MAPSYRQRLGWHWSLSGLSPKITETSTQSRPLTKLVESNLHHVVDCACEKEPQLPTCTKTPNPSIEIQIFFYPSPMAPDKLTQDYSAIIWHAMWISCYLRLRRESVWRGAGNEISEEIVVTTTRGENKSLQRGNRDSVHNSTIIRTTMAITTATVTRMTINRSKMWIV